MYFDYLHTETESPPLFLINCKVSKKNVGFQLGYVRQMIGNQPIILKDKRGKEICLLDLPTNIRFLTRDLILAEKEFLEIPIKENYVEPQYFIHES